MVKYCTVENTGGGPAVGGGIYAVGDVDIEASSVRGNKVLSTTSNARAGGVFAGGRITLTGASITDNEIVGATQARGGGLYAQGGLTAKYAMIGKNTATTISGSGSTPSTAGGAWVSAGEVNLIQRSTVYENTADNAAALLLGGAGGSAPSAGETTIAQSTIANNRSNATQRLSGGAIRVLQSTKIHNSTISGNIETNALDNKYGAGLHLSANTPLDLISTVISGNHLEKSNATIAASDVSSSDTVNPPTISGDHNLISFPMYVTYPTDTITAEAANLGPLQDNGGVTLTMLPPDGSPVIDAGTSNSYTTDQRGAGFDRTKGTATDIGAVEFDPTPPDGPIFSDGFEGN